MYSVLISGGFPSSSRKKVELYNLGTKTSCFPPDLPEERSGHTSVGGVICGGGSEDSTWNSCIDISSGSWSSDNYQSIRQKFGHESWDIGQSFMLLGGGTWEGDARRTTDIVNKNDGTVVPTNFLLEYDVQ